MYTHDLTLYLKRNDQEMHPLQQMRQGWALIDVPSKYDQIRKLAPVLAYRWLSWAQYMRWGPKTSWQLNRYI